MEDLVNLHWGLVNLLRKIIILAPTNCNCNGKIIRKNKHAVMYLPKSKGMGPRWLAGVRNLLKKYLQFVSAFLFNRYEASCKIELRLTKWGGKTTVASNELSESSKPGPRNAEPRFESLKPKPPTAKPNQWLGSSSLRKCSWSHLGPKSLRMIRFGLLFK